MTLQAISLVNLAEKSLSAVHIISVDYTQYTQNIKCCKMAVLMHSVNKQAAQLSVQTAGSHMLSRTRRALQWTEEPLPDF